MPRMSKKRKMEWSFFLSDRNRITIVVQLSRQKSKLFIMN